MDVKSPVFEFRQSTVLPPTAITRWLRLIGSSACRGDKRVPLAIVANLTGLSVRTLYRARDGAVTDDVAAILTPLIRQHEAGKLRLRRTGPRSRDPNLWQLVDP